MPAAAKSYKECKPGLQALQRCIEQIITAVGGMQGHLLHEGGKLIVLVPGQVTGDSVVSTVDLLLNPVLMACKQILMSELFIWPCQPFVATGGLRYIH